VNNPKPGSEKNSFSPLAERLSEQGVASLDDISEIAVCIENFSSRCEIACGKKPGVPFLAKWGEFIKFDEIFRHSDGIFPCSIPNGPPDNGICRVQAMDFHDGLDP